METSTLDYTIAMNDIVEDKTLLQYKNIRIYIGHWRHQIVCVKEITNVSCTSNNDIKNELEILSKCIHPKIVQFLGANLTKNKTTIVFEYMSSGTLTEYLRNNTLSIFHKIHMIIDIIIGINYLHNREPNIVLHRDLKPENILINQYGQVKISDFGISKLVQIKQSKQFTGHTGETGTYVWMSPEVLKHEPYNYKADIYSIGLLIYYIITEKIPFIETNMNTIQLMFAKFKNELVIENTNDDFLDTIIQDCCMYDKELRPDSSYIIHKLQMYVNTL
jgi:serine/threonine protein kinase